MALITVALVVASALMHAGWNFVLKGQQSRLPFMLAALGFAAAGLLAVVGTAVRPALPPPGAWPLAVASGLCHLVYFICLTEAYATGDLSLVYPASRGGGVLMVAVAAPLLLGERPAAGAWLGIGLIVLGLLVISGPPQPGAGAGPGRRRALLFSLATAATIAAYTLVDKVGVSRTSPVVYWTWANTVAVAGLAGWLLLRGGLRELGRAVDSWRLAAAVGPAIVAAYLVFLYALAMAPAAYVYPLRQVSLVFAVAAGVLIRHEPLGWWRLGGAALLLGGAALLAVG